MGDNTVSDERNTALERKRYTCPTFININNQNQSCYYITTS